MNLACTCSFNAEIDFDGSKLLERYMIRQDVPRMREQFARAASSDASDDFPNIMKAYGTEVVRTVGSEVRSRSPCCNLKIAQMIVLARHAAQVLQDCGASICQGCVHKEAVALLISSVMSSLCC